MTNRAVAIMGATATGKSDLAIRLAERFNGEIISMDSRQVYRGLDIGTGKVTLEDRRRVTHHLIDILDPHEFNSAGAHVALAEAVFQRISAGGKTVFFVGGTGLYFRVLFRGIIEARALDEDQRRLRRELAPRSTEELHRELAALDPDRANALSTRDRVRIVRAIEIARLTGKTYSEHVARQSTPSRWTGLKIVLTLPRVALRKRIGERTRDMYRRGWVDEVRSLIARGVGLDAPAMGSLGYDVIAQAIVEGGDPRSTLEQVTTRTRQYAKRQETFFRSEPDAVWFDVSVPGAGDEIEGFVRRCLETETPGPSSASSNLT
jgi:tRNA dimethylallyltransferase